LGKRRGGQSGERGVQGKGATPRGRTQSHLKIQGKGGGQRSGVEKGRPIREKKKLSGLVKSGFTPHESGRGDDAGGASFLAGGR